MNETISQPAAAAVIELNQVLVDLDQAGRRLPVAAIQAARQHRDEIIPLLIEAIRTATARARTGEVPKGQAHFFAFFLLAEFRAKQALPAILEAVSLPGELPFDLFGDAMHEVLSRTLAALADDPQAVIDGLISDRDVNQYVRWNAALTYPILVREQRLTRDEAVVRLREYLTAAIRDRDRDIVGPLVCTLADLAGREGLPEIDEAFRLELVEDDLTGINLIHDDINRGEAKIRETLERCGPVGIDDTIDELSHWASFRESPDAGESTRGNLLSDKRPNLSDALNRLLIDKTAAARPGDFGEPSDYEPPPEPVRRGGLRVGRNDPCPCGSGKKFKKCCGARR